jgi:vancomycin resistance protein YoaR
LVRVPVLFISGGILLVLVLLIFLAAFQLRYADRIVPGVWAFDVNLSGMTRDQAVAALSGRFTYPEEAVFTFRDGDRFWQKTAAELGVSYNPEDTVEQAFVAGHSGDLLRDVFGQAGIWLNGRAIAPVVRYDQTAAVQILTDIAAEINSPAQDARLAIEGITVKTTPSKVGRTLDIKSTLSRLDGVIVSLDTGAEIPLVVHETPPVIWDAEIAANKARAALSSPLTLTADDQQGGTLGPWIASVDQIAALLVVTLNDNGDGTRSYDVEVNMAAFRGFLDTLAPGLVASPKDARFHINQTTAQLEVIQPSISGRTLNITDTLVRLEEAVFNSQTRTVAMAFDYVQPHYHNGVTASSLGITEMVGEATTYFSGSTASRRNNIIESASRFDGIIIGPNEEFSYNTLLGDISPETGFERAKIILGSRTIDGVGGGVCQVSTTAFRAAFNAGFYITERHSHGYRVGFYEINSAPGLDAAIYQPTTDFRFRNDTPYHLLIETSVYPGRDAIQFRLYSTNPGRKVVIEPPLIQNLTPAKPTIYEANGDLVAGQSLQVDWAAQGADVTVVRVIQDLNGNTIRREEWFTHYEAWAAVVQVPIGDPRLG